MAPQLAGGVYWAVQTMQRFGARMVAEAHGSIVNIATMYAAVATRPQLYEGTTSLNPPDYSASKAALVAFTFYTASFWFGSGVRANCISRGPFSKTEDIVGKTPLSRSLRS